MKKLLNIFGANVNGFMQTSFVIGLICSGIGHVQAQSNSDTLQLQDVVVTGTNQALSRDYLPYTVSVVGEKQIENSGANKLLNVLSGQVPSLFVTQKGILGYTSGSNGGSGAISFRGVGSSGVLIMVDGQPQFAGIYSHSVDDFYGKDYVDRVEVLRNPGSVLYGSNAMAGVINVITKKPRKDGTHLSLQSQYGSYNTWQTTLTATSRYGRLSAMGTASYDRTDGNISGMDFKQWSGYGKVDYELSNNWTAALDFTLTNFKAHDPVYYQFKNPDQPSVYYQSITRGEASAIASNHYGRTNGTVRAYYTWGNHYIDDPRHFHSTDDRLGVLAYQNVELWRGATGTLGFDFDRYSGVILMSGGQTWEQNQMATLRRKTINEYSPYITLSQRLLGDQMHLSGGLRLSCSDMFSTNLVPQVGVAYSPANLFTVKASAAMGYRNPSFKELYLYKMANPDLEPEKMWTYEAGIRKNFSRYFGIDVTAYYSRGSNIIQTVDGQNRNTGKFINKGIEVTATSHPLDCLSLNASYSYLHTSVDKLTGAPRHQYFLGVDWQASKHIEVGAELKGVDNLYVGETVDNQSYAVVNLKASYQVVKWLGLFVRLDNITDASYMINRGYPMPGFTAMGGFKLSI